MTIFTGVIEGVFYRFCGGDPIRGVGHRETRPHLLMVASSRYWRVERYPAGSLSRNAIWLHETYAAAIEQFLDDLTFLLPDNL